MAIVLLAPPTQEPLRLDEAKTHLRVTIDEDNALILGLISAARDYLEKVTGRQFLLATYRLSGPRFMGDCFRLPRPPLHSLAGTYVDSTKNTQPLGITYVDSAGVLQTLATTAYIVDTDSQPGLVCLAPSQSWPSLYAITNAVQVTYKAGYATPAQFFQRHASLRSALLLLVAHLYEYREASVEKALSEIPLGVESLLWINRLVEVV